MINMRTAYRALVMITLAFNAAVLAPVNTAPASQVLPVCELEDGSTQKTCRSKQDAERQYVTHNYGEWTYYPGQSEAWTHTP